MLIKDYQGVNDYLLHIQTRRYSTGVMHVTAPQWMIDLRDLLELCRQLNELRKNDATNQT